MKKVIKKKGRDQLWHASTCVCEDCVRPNRKRSPLPVQRSGNTEYTDPGFRVTKGLEVRHEFMYDVALEAIKALAKDDSVPPAWSLRALRRLRKEALAFIQGLKGEADPDVPY